MKPPKFRPHITGDKPTISRMGRYQASFIACDFCQGALRVAVDEYERIMLRNKNHTVCAECVCRLTGHGTIHSSWHDAIVQPENYGWVTAPPPPKVKRTRKKKDEDKH